MHTREIYDREKFGQYVRAARGLGLLRSYTRNVADGRVLVFKDGVFTKLKQITYSAWVPDWQARSINHHRD
jgi:hypothetical protein